MSTEMKKGVKFNILPQNWLFFMLKIQNKRVEFQADDAEVRKVKNSKLGPHLEVGVKPQHQNASWCILYHVGKTILHKTIFFLKLA